MLTVIKADGVVVWGSWIGRRGLGFAFKGLKSVAGWDLWLGVLGFGICGLGFRAWDLGFRV